MRITIGLFKSKVILYPISILVHIRAATAQTVTLCTMKPSAGFIFKVRHVLKIEVSFIASTPKSYGTQCGSGLFQTRKTFTAGLIYLKTFCLMQ